MKLKALGYWSSGGSSDLPGPALLVDARWDESERRIVSDYLNEGQIAREFMGASRCRICGELNGSAELTDGEFIWPTGLSHYVEVHSVRLPRAFIEHSLRRRADLEAADVDRSWWEEHARAV